MGRTRLTAPFWGSQWAGELAENAAGPTEEQRRRAEQAFDDLGRYMAGLIERRREEPGEDLLSGLATDGDPPGRMEDPQLVATAALLLSSPRP